MRRIRRGRRRRGKSFRQGGFDETDREAEVLLWLEMLRMSKKKGWILLLLCAAIAVGVLLNRPYWRLAKQTAQQAHARENIRSINGAEQQFAKLNPLQGFACELDDLRRAGWVPRSPSTYKYQIFCDGLKRPRTSYLIVAYPEEKLVESDGVWGFWVLCSDQSGKRWQNLSREQMRDKPSEDEKAGRYDFVGICRRNGGATRK